MLSRRRNATRAALLAAMSAVAIGAGIAVLLAAGSGRSPRPIPEASFRYRAGGLIPVSASVSASTSAISSLASGALAVELGRLPPGTSAVASALARPVPVYRSPRDQHPEQRLPIRDQFGITQVLLVKRALPGWLEVYLPVRPNDTTGWVPATSVGVTLDPYQVVVDTAAHRITTLRLGRAVMHATVGIGKPATPTPHGLFFVMEKLRMVPATGPYGTYAFGLSAYSNVLTTFGTGQAQIALHGTNEPSTVGQDTSNGCLHLSDSVANWLARTLPLGTPVQIS
jgi:lipoprotein-anchoring transpeptidase ErfK/SrfK